MGRRGSLIIHTQDGEMRICCLEHVMDGLSEENQSRHLSHPSLLGRGVAFSVTYISARHFCENLSPPFPYC